MDSNTKSFLKKTLLGLLGGGALASLYSANKDIEEKKTLEESDKNDITVPLSKKNYLKVLKTKSRTVSEPEKKQDVSNMSSRDLALLKKEILRNKAASCPTIIKDTTGPATSISEIRKSKEANYVTLRNAKGQFSTENDLSKKAGITNDALGTILDGAGVVGGFYGGMVVMKHVSDKIRENRKKKQLEKSRKIYADMLTKEVNDEDTPYYKRAADRGTLGALTGVTALAGLGAASIAGLVVYRIMEKRRKEEEKAADKDLDRYPLSKTIKYKFASEKNPTNGFFR